MLGGNFILPDRPAFFILELFVSFCAFFFLPSPFLAFGKCYRIKDKIYQL